MDLDFFRMLELVLVYAMSIAVGMYSGSCPEGYNYYDYRCVSNPHCNSTDGESVCTMCEEG